MVYGVDMSQHAPNILPNMPHNGTQHVTGTAADMSPPLRATVKEAAKILGTSENAVRKRIERGTLASEKVGGERYVLLLDSEMPKHVRDTVGDLATDMAGDLALMQAHLDSMQEQVGYLKAVIQTRDEELRRKDHIIAALTERIPELEAPRETRDSPRTISEEPSGTPPPSAEAERPSWLKRFFGLE